MSTSKYGRYLLGALVAAAIPLGIGTAMAQDAPRGRDAGPPGGMSRIFSEMDTNKDGRISRAEVEAFNKARAGEIDANNDGTITTEELRAWTEKQRERRLTERLARMDANGDGVVSVDEFTAAGVWRMARMDRTGDGFIDRRDRHRSGKAHRGHDGRGHHRGHR